MQQYFCCGLVRSTRGGYPGTNEIKLGEDTLKSLCLSSGHVAIPCYDESAYLGLGNRTSKNQWPEVEMPLDIVILERWMLGYQPLGKEDEIDKALSEYMK